MALAGAIVHELMHVAAARSAGLPARIGLGTRLHNLVLQTDVTAAWSLPRAQRYRIYLAGMAWDVAAISTAILIRAYAAPAPGITMLLGAFILIAALNLVMQFQVFMRTDVYYVLMEARRCRDLFHDGLRHGAHVARRVASALHRGPTPQSPTATIGPREARAVRLYAPVLVLGTCTALAAYAVLVLPILIRTAASGGAPSRTSPQAAA